MDVEPRGAEHLYRRRDGVGEDAGQRRRDGEAETAGGRERCQIERSAPPRSETDREIHGRDAMPAPERTGHDRLDGDRPQPVRRDEEPHHRHHRDAGRAHDEDGPGPERVDETPPHRGRRDADGGREHSVCGHENEAHLEVRQHVIGEEPRRDPDRCVPGEEVDEQRTRLRVADGARKITPRRRRQVLARAGALLREQQPDADEAGRTRHRQQDSQRLALVAARTERVEGQPGAQRGGRARDVEIDHATSKEPSPDRAGYEVAHPRRPRVAADHTEDRGDGDDRHERRQRRRRRQVNKRNGDERQPHQSGGADGRDGQALGSEPLREPRGGQLNDLRGDRQCREQPDRDGAGAEVERPPGEDSAARAGAEDLGGSTLGDRGIERGAQASGAGRGVTRGGRERTPFERRREHRQADGQAPGLRATRAACGEPGPEAVRGTSSLSRERAATEIR